MKKAMIVLSIVLNIVLIVLIVGGIRYSRRTVFRTVAEATTAEVRLQEHFLKELESGDLKRIEVVKDMMRKNIENGKRASASWESAVKW